MKMIWAKAQCFSCGVLIDQCLLCFPDGTTLICQCDWCFKETKRAADRGESVEQLTRRLFAAKDRER